MLAKKDAEENAALEELRAQARKELAEWYARNDEQLAQTKTSNRCDLGKGIMRASACFANPFHSTLLSPSSPPFILFFPFPPSLSSSSLRQAESAFIEERDENIPGHEWERVARLCDFNPKNSKNTKDVSRMRSIFLQLKQTPMARD